MKPLELFKTDDETIEETYEELEKKYRWLPYGFQVAIYGGYLSPAGKFYENKTAYNSYRTLTRAGFFIDHQYQNKWKLEDYALFKEWVIFDYFQSYGGRRVNFSKHIKRRLILTVYPPTMADNYIFQRVKSILRFYEELFDGRLDYEIYGVDFLNIDDEEKPVRRVITQNRRVFSDRAAEMYLNSLKRGFY